MIDPHQRHSGERPQPMCYAGLSHPFLGVMFPLLDVQIMKSEGMRIGPVLVLVTSKLKKPGNQIDPEKKNNLEKNPTKVGMPPRFL